MNVAHTLAAVGASPWSGAGWFFAAVLLLDFFDIAMPRGDSVPVSGALCGAAVVLLGPVQAAVISVGSAVISQFPRGGRGVGQMLASVAARLAAVGASWLVMSAVTLGFRGVTPFGGALLAPAVYLVVELAVSQVVFAVRRKRPALRMLTGNLTRQAPLLLAETSAAALTVVTYPEMSAWSLIPVVALLLLMRQSYALLLEIRETYRNTVEVLVEAAEGQDERRGGHSERTAAIARSIGQRVGLSSSQIELLSYAALLHDIDAIAGTHSVSAEEVPDCGDKSRRGHSSAVFEGVDFFANVAPILGLCDGDADKAAAASEPCLISALIVALASDADVFEHPAAGLAHSGSAVARVSPFVPPEMKARAVAAALALGYKTPAVD